MALIHKGFCISGLLELFDELFDCLFFTFVPFNPDVESKKSLELKTRPWKTEQ